jgi:heterodisulfide reductase subunit C
MKTTELVSSGEELLRKVEELSGQDIKACYQCGKCSGGCPFTLEMDLSPREVIEFLLDGRVEVLSKEVIWFCASCFTCTVRCPNNIDIAAVCEALRQIILRHGLDRIDMKISEDIPQIALVSSFRKMTG